MSTSELNIPIDSPLEVEKCYCALLPHLELIVEPFYNIYSCFLYNLYKIVLVSWYIVHFCTQTSSKSATVCATTTADCVWNEMFTFLYKYELMLVCALHVGM